MQRRSVAPLSLEAMSQAVCTHRGNLCWPALKAHLGMRLALRSQLEPLVEPQNLWRLLPIWGQAQG